MLVLLLGASGRLRRVSGALGAGWGCLCSCVPGLFRARPEGGGVPGVLLLAVVDHLVDPLVP